MTKVITEKPVAGVQMDTTPRCTSCDTPLTPDEIGLHKKLVNRGATTFLCKSCLCARFHMTKQQADEMIKRFREQGCVLFC